MFDRFPPFPFSFFNYCLHLFIRSDEEKQITSRSTSLKKGGANNGVKEGKRAAAGRLYDAEEGEEVHESVECRLFFASFLH